MSESEGPTNEEERTRFTTPWVSNQGSEEKRDANEGFPRVGRVSHLWRTCGSWSLQDSVVSREGTRLPSVQVGG